MSEYTSYKKRKGERIIILKNKNISRREKNIKTT